MRLSFKVEDLVVSFGEKPLQVSDFFRHRGHPQRNLVGRLLHNLIHICRSFDWLCLCAKIKRLERLLHVWTQLWNAANNGRLRFSKQRILEYSCQLAISKVDVIVVFISDRLSLGKFLDNIWQCQKRLVNVASFSKSQTDWASFWRAFRSRQINNLDVGNPYGFSLRLYVRIFNVHVDFEDSVRARTLGVHSSFCKNAHFISFSQQVLNFMQRCDFTRR